MHPFIMSGGTGFAHYLTSKFFIKGSFSTLSDMLELNVLPAELGVE